MPLIERTPGSLPPGHRCRVDDLAYTSVSDWFNDHYGRVPIQAAAGLDRHIRRPARPSPKPSPPSPARAGRSS